MKSARWQLLDDHGNPYDALVSHAWGSKVEAAEFLARLLDLDPGHVFTRLVRVMPKRPGLAKANAPGATARRQGAA